MKKEGWMNLLRVAITVAALIFLLLTVNLGQVLAELRQADLRYLGAAFAIFTLSMGVRSLRWFVLLRGLGSDVSFGRLLRLYFVGQFFSIFLPSQYGGDVVRALELTQDTESSAAIGTVFLDRLCGIMVNFALGLAVLPFVIGRLETWLIVLLIAVAGGGMAGGGLLLQGRLLRRLTHWLPDKLSLVGEGALAKIYAAITGCGWRAIAGAFAVSLLFNVMNVFFQWLCGRALGLEIDMAYFFVVVPLLSVAGLIPSVGGWGVRENVGRAVFTPTGAGEDAATALAVSIGLVMQATGLVGGVVHGVGWLSDLLTRRRAAKPPATEDAAADS